MGVQAPQTGICLTHGVEGILDCVRADGLTLQSNRSNLVLVSKDLEKLGRVVNAKNELCIKGEVMAEVLPETPMGVRGLGLTRSDTSLHHCLRSTEVMAEITYVGVQSCQEGFCG